MQIGRTKASTTFRAADGARAPGLSSAILGLVVAFVLSLLFLGITNFLFSHAKNQRNDELFESVSRAARAMVSVVDIDQFRRVIDGDGVRAEDIGRQRAHIEAFGDRIGSDFRARAVGLDANGELKVGLDVTNLDGLVPEGEDGAVPDAAYLLEVLSRTSTAVESIVDQQAGVVLVTQPLRRAGRMVGVLAYYEDISEKFRLWDRSRELARFVYFLVLFMCAIVGGLVGQANYLTERLRASNRQVKVLNARLAVENSRMEGELAIARRMQQLVLPPTRELASIPGLDIAGVMEPAEDVGGDYYDVLLHREGAVKIAIGDVCGHGLESGMVMIMTQAAVRMGMIAGIDDPEHLYASINRLIFRNLSRMDSRSNLTLSMLDIFPDGTCVVTGQHEEFFIIRANGALETIDTIELGIPVGLDENIDELIGSTSFRLLADEWVLLFSDGVTEAENRNGEFFGATRLCRAFAEAPKESAQGVVDFVLDRLTRFIGDRAVLDDIAIVVVGRSR